MKILGQYKNGNYDVRIFDDGTKIRVTEENDFISEFPENIDIKITNYCDASCKFCHEDSTTSGRHADLKHYILYGFLTTLKPYTELAIGGGNPLDHPQLRMLLSYLRSRGVIPNLTVNQVHFEKSFSEISSLVKNNLIYGVGVSLVNPTDNFLSLISKIPNAVIHTINGVTTMKSYEKLGNKNLKVLILGYKMFRRGVNYYSETVRKNMNELSNNITSLMPKFDVLSFDNLAIEQLDMKSHLSSAEWDKFYMGDDGQFTMYVDLVNGVYAKNSTSKITYPLTNSILEMFKVAKNEKSS